MTTGPEKLRIGAERGETQFESFIKDSNDSTISAVLMNVWLYEISPVDLFCTLKS